MTCVSRQRAATLSRVFTFSVLTLVTANLNSCVASTTRINIRQLRPSTPPQPATPVQPIASGAATPPREANELPPSALTRTDRLKLEVVPQLQVSALWEVHFGPECPAATRSGNGVEVFGDFVVEGYELRIKLDAAISRGIPERHGERKPLTLGQLMDAWSSLAQGNHRLAVFAVRTSDGVVPLDIRGVPAVAFCDFEVGPGGNTFALEGPLTLVLLGPEGTLHGQSTRPLVQAFWDQGSPTRSTPDSKGAVLMVGLPDGHQEALDLASGAYRLLPTSSESGLPGGDYALWTQTPALARKGVPVDPYLVSVITVNPE